MVERGGEVSAIDLEAQLRKLEDAENKVLRLLEIASEVIDTLADSSSASDVSHDSSETLVQKRERLQADTADFLQLIQEVHSAVAPQIESLHAFEPAKQTSYASYLLSRVAASQAAANDSSNDVCVEPSRP